MILENFLFYTLQIFLNIFVTFNYFNINLLFYFGIECTLNLLYKIANAVTILLILYFAFNLLFYCKSKDF